MRKHARDGAAACFDKCLAQGHRERVYEEMVESMRAYAADSRASAVPAVRDVCIPLAKAQIAFGSGDYDCTIDRLAPVRYEVRRIGGSHAQRDLFAELLVEAALRAGRFPLARALDGMGDAAQAATARDRAERILAA